MMDILTVNPDLDDAQIAELCNDGQLPTAKPLVIAAVRQAAAEGSI